MNLLPWLLNWPPRPASIVAFLVVTAFSVGTLVVFAPVTDQMTADEVTVRTSDVSVRLNDEIEIPDTDGSVQTCLGSGTPGDSLLVVADVTVEIPPADSGHGSDAGPYTVEARLDGTSETTSERIDDTGEERWHVFWVAEDDETLSVGEMTEFRVTVSDSDSVLTSTTRSVTVEEGSRSYDCDRSWGSARAGTAGPRDGPPNER